MGSANEYSEAFLAVVDYAEAQGVTSLKDVEGCWESAVDPRWWIAINPHHESAECSRDVLVDPYSCYVEFNGWPAGWLHAFGGWIAAGELANESNFIDALKAATGRAA